MNDFHSLDGDRVLVDFLSVLSAIEYTVEILWVELGDADEGLNKVYCRQE